MPAEAALGDATIWLATAGGLFLRSPLSIAPLTPAVFTANGSGAGAPLGRLLRRGADDDVTASPLAECNDSGEFTPVAIDLTDDSVTVEIELEATGLPN